jgi:preprotein translocase subunit SecG
MTLLLNVLLVVQILAALAMIGLILIQHGKGADMGAAFGSGSSGSLFGASGSANFLSRSTSVLAAVFFVCTLALAYFGNLKPTTEGSSGLETAPLNLLRWQNPILNGHSMCRPWILNTLFGQDAMITIYVFT